MKIFHEREQPHKAKRSGTIPALFVFFMGSVMFRFHRLMPATYAAFAGSAGYMRFPRRRPVGGIFPRKRGWTFFFYCRFLIKSSLSAIRTAPLRSVFLFTAPKGGAHSPYPALRLHIGDWFRSLPPECTALKCGRKCVSR